MFGIKIHFSLLSGLALGSAGFLLLHSYRAAVLTGFINLTPPRRWAKEEHSSLTSGQVPWPCLAVAMKLVTRKSTFSP